MTTKKKAAKKATPKKVTKPRTKKPAVHEEGVEEVQAPVAETKPAAASKKGKKPAALSLEDRVKRLEAIAERHGLNEEE